MNKKVFNIRSSKEKGSKTQTLVLEGDLSIRNAALIKKKLAAVKFTGDIIRIHLNNVDNLDITIIQIMYSLVNTLENQGKKIEIYSELPDDLEKVLINAGFSEITKTA